jgi:drug/metabolite transporter (DMT)-like permease
MPTSRTPGINLAFRLCGGAAFVGGGLRVADAYLAVTNAIRTQQIAYLVTDLMLIVGLCGIYLPKRKTLGLIGLLGFAASNAGLLIVRISAFNHLGSNAYLTGATVTLIGVVAMGTVMLIRKAFPKLGPVLWIASFVVGLIGLLSPGLSWAVALAGVIFGAGFIVAGINLFQSKSPTHSELPVATSN